MASSGFTSARSTRSKVLAEQASFAVVVKGIPRFTLKRSPCYQSSDVLLLLGGPGELRSLTVPAGKHSWAIEAADLNGDGSDDLVISDDANPRITVYVSRDRIAGK